MNVLNVRRMSAETAAKETSGTPERGVEESTDHGTLQFALRYEAEASALVVTVVKATGLRIDDTESVNPYVKVRVLLDKHQKAKTRVVRRSVNPIFDETTTMMMTTTTRRRTTDDDGRHNDDNTTTNDGQ